MFTLHFKSEMRNKKNLLKFLVI